MNRFAEALRALRSARGYSIRTLADRAHYSRSYIDDLEKGRKKPPLETAKALDRALGSGTQLADAAAAGDASLLPDWADGRVGTVLTGRHRPDPATVDHLAQALTVQRRLEDTAGSGLVLPAALAQAATVAQIRAVSDGQLRDRLLSLEAQYGQFAGWLHQDSGDSSASEQWYARALSQAHEADDPAMVASVLSMRSNAAWGAGDARKAVRLAEASCRQPTTPGVLALSHQQLARGLALAGDRAGTLRALGEAEELFAAAEHRRDDEPDWIYFHDAARMRIQRAMCLRDLGDHRAAADLLEAAIADLPARFSRDRGTYLARLAVTYALAGERDGALATAAEARALAVATRSARTLSEVDRAIRLTHQSATDGYS